MLMGICLISCLFLVLGVFLTKKHLKKYFFVSTTCLPITILKPLKNLEDCLAENLESFFHQDYFKFEILFSVRDATDPVIPLVQSLIKKYSYVDARLIISETDFGKNPKINNLLKSYQEAKYDLILISDSNILAEKSYLTNLMSQFTKDIGLMTSLIYCQKTETLGSVLDRLLVSVYYARWMVLCEKINIPVTVGKSLIFRKSEMDNLGGLKRFANYLAEDFKMGEVYHKETDLKVIISKFFITQNMVYSFKQFWNRHLRWLVMRKTQYPVVFALEPLTTPLVTSILLQVYFNSWYITFSYLLFCLSLDLMLLKNISCKDIFGWFLKEILFLVLWCNTIFVHQITWKTTKVNTHLGGVID